MNQETKNALEQLVYLIAVLIFLAMIRQLYIFLTDLI